MICPGWSVAFGGRPFAAAISRQGMPNRSPSSTKLSPGCTVRTTGVGVALAVAVAVSVGVPVEDGVGLGGVGVLV